MNGVSKAAEGPETDVSTLAGVRISLDPYTLDTSIGKRRLLAIEQDGSLIYGHPKTPQAKLTERLERIWNEYPNGLLDLTEDSLASLPQDEPVVNDEKKDGADDGEEEERYRGDLMSAEEMEKLRSDVFMQLNDARNELWFALELAKTLSLSKGFEAQPPLLPGQAPPPKRSKGINAAAAVDAKAAAPTAPGAAPVEPPVLPPGTFTTLPITAHRKAPHQEAYDLERALKAKQEALDDCSALIDAAVDELQHMAAAGEQFWDSIRQLRDGDAGRGQWAVVPKPDFGRTMLEGEKAKDVIIPYAVDEAPPLLRARCLAAFDLDPSKEEALAFGARSHLRLRITIDDGIATSASSLDISEPDHTNVRGTMELVQLEAFEEEIFGEIVGEASRMTGAIIEGRSVEVQYEEQHLAFELCDPRETRPSDPPISDSAELLLVSSRLLLSRLHRARKTQLLFPNCNSVSAGLPSLLQPLLRLLRYSSSVSRTLATFELFALTMQQAGLDASVHRSFFVQDEGGEAALAGLLQGGDDLDVLSGTIELDFEDSQGIALRLPITRAFSLRTSRAQIDLTHPDDLASIMADDLARQLVHVALPILEEEIEEESVREQVFLDELECSIAAGQAGTISFSIPAPFDKVFARVEGGETRVEPFISGKGISLREWLSAFAARMGSLA